MTDYEKLEKVERRLYEVCRRCNSLESALVAASDPETARSLYEELERASRKFTALAVRRDVLRRACLNRGRDPKNAGSAPGKNSEKFFV
jgi:hypothetical protein